MNHARRDLCGGPSATEVPTAIGLRGGDFKVPASGKLNTMPSIIAYSRSQLRRSICAEPRTRARCETDPAGLVAEQVVEKAVHILHTAARRARRGRVRDQTRLLGRANRPVPLDLIDKRRQLGAGPGHVAVG